MEFVKLAHLINQWIVFTNFIKIKLYSKRLRSQCPGCLVHAPGHETSDASCWVRENYTRPTVHQHQRY